MLAPLGLTLFGWFRADDMQSGLLIGNAGSSLWSAFSDWHSDHPGPDPLNRWTVSALEPVARTLGARARYPFGNPVWPFQRYAAEATGMRASPLGLLIHPRYGLWTAFRAALIFDATFVLQAPEMDLHPCDRCEEKPCLSACPVDAFSVDSYDVGRCRSYLRAHPGGDCVTNGCRARLACPVGRSHAYHEAQQRFHMAAFLGVGGTG